MKINKIVEKKNVCNKNNFLSHIIMLIGKFLLLMLIPNVIRILLALCNLEQSFHRSYNQY